jgi:hypothetical protein
LKSFRVIFYTHIIFKIGEEVIQEQFQRFYEADGRTHLLQILANELKNSDFISDHTEQHYIKKDNISSFLIEELKDAE